MAKAMSDDELRALTDSEMRNSVGYASGKLAAMRQKAMWYYLGEAKGDLAPPEIEGRSRVVVPVVRNTIESMIPQLMVKFGGSDQVVEFLPNKPGDEQAAEMATEYVSYLYNIKNDGERVTYTAIKDALLSKKGIVKVWWDNADIETSEEYRGISDIELAQVMDDEEVEITAQKAYPDEEDQEQRQQAMQQLGQQLERAMADAQGGNPQAAQAVPQLQQQLAQLQGTPTKLVYDISCKRTQTGGKICVDSVPPEEFLIARDAKTIKDARFCAHRVPRSRSDLKASGYKNVDNISSDDQGAGLNMERIERLSWDDELAYAGMGKVDSSDDSQQIIWVTECYIRADVEGSGISQLWKVVRAGNQILDKQITDVAPFIDFDALPMPHKFHGLSVADLAMEGQRTETSILRSTLDNMYLQANGRYYAVEGQVNLDDLLTSRPGGVVRIKQPGSVGRLDQGAGDLGSNMSMMEYMKGFNEDSTGWTRYNQGSDGDSLNQTATGMNIVTNRADMRLDLIARNLARGFSDMFNMILKLVSQYQQKEEIVRLRGEWVPIDPREWTNGFTVSINVGLGTGNRDQQIKQLMALLNEQKQGMQIGIANPANIYEAEKELVKALGFKNADKYWTDPSKVPPQPPQPTPAQVQMQIEQVKGQNTMQIEQMKAQLSDAQHQRELQANMQLEQNKQQMQSADVQAQNQIVAQREAQGIALQAQADQRKQEMDAMLRQQEIEFEKWKAELASQTSIYIEQLKQQGAAPTALQGDPEMTSALAASIDGFRAALNQMSAPKQIVRGPDGRAQGII